MSKLAFCLMGATATGKTAVAVELVQHFPFEIISIDSAMIYREMNIGTAKPDAETLQKAPHHLIDIIDPSASYSVANCVSDVRELVTKINNRGKIPLLVGGTMLYFNAIQNGISKLPEASQSVRQEILDLAEKIGWDKVYAKLAIVDPETAKRVNVNDKSRIQRALEVYTITNQPLSKLIAENSSIGLDLEFINIALMPMDRDILHARINQRFLQMLDLGLITEVEELVAKWKLDKDNPALRCVGYRQVFAYLQGEIDYATMQSKGCAATRQLAKRQLTWLRKWPETNVFAAEDPNNLAAIMAFTAKILDNSSGEF